LHKIISRFEIDQIILFGSYARGDYHENSDIDLIIVGSFHKRFFERIGKILASMQHNENPFILTILSEGIALI